MSRANMMLLYENGFDDFSSGGFCYIHKFLFGEHSEFGYLEEILKDAICTEPIDYTENRTISKEKKKKYKSDNYTPTKHEYIE